MSCYDITFRAMDMYKYSNMSYNTFLCVYSACGPSVTLLPMRQQRAAAAAVGSAQFELVEVEVTEESSSSIIPPPTPQRGRLNRGSSSLLAPSTLVRQKCMRQRPSAAAPTPAAGSAGVSRTNSMRRLQAWVVTQSPPYRRQSKTMQSNDLIMSSHGTACL